MRALPGPAGGSWLTGHINDINRSERDRAECHLKWAKEFGHVYVYKSLLNVRTLLEFKRVIILLNLSNRILNYTVR